LPPEASVLVLRTLDHALLVTEEDGSTA
jgi:hypothetical protein